MTIRENLECSQYFNFETDILENENLEYRLLVESTKIDNVSFLYKTVISKASVKINEMMSTKWNYHKERSFTSNYFIFWKILFQFKNFL